jgi:ABC-type multidrug transport system ATPase subunit
MCVQLVNMPSMLFAQQPTNGLDSSNALVLIQHCKALAIAAQRAMLLSLVQPSPQLLLQFDAVMVMSKGGNTPHNH